MKRIKSIYFGNPSESLMQSALRWERGNLRTLAKRWVSRVRTLEPTADGPPAVASAKAGKRGTWGENPRLSSHELNGPDDASLRIDTREDSPARQILVCSPEPKAVLPQPRLGVPFFNSQQESDVFG